MHSLAASKCIISSATLRLYTLTATIHHHTLLCQHGYCNDAHLQRSGQQDATLPTPAHISDVDVPCRLDLASAQQHDAGCRALQA